MSMPRMKTYFHPALPPVRQEASNQLNLALGWKGDLKKFCRTMEMVRDVLRRIDENYGSTNHSDLTTWLQDLRAIADEAEDIMEDVAYENLRRQLAYPKWKKVRYFFTRSNPLLFRLKMANKVKSLGSSLVELNANAARLGLQYRLATGVVEPVAEPLQTNSFLSSQVVGREEDVSKIENLLVDSTGHQQDLSVVAIVGMPGLGKTTLAKAVSKTDKICQLFGKNIFWVSVSENFDSMWILKMMLESISSDDGVKVNSEEAAMRKIQDVLDGKDYLLILDDVWNEERRKWEALRSCLLGISKNKGNSVLVTTRSETVAAIMTHAKEHIYCPKILEDDKCWTIIKQRAFGGSSAPLEFEEVGKEISQKCKGVPLVASLIGATLQNRRDLREWESVLQNHVWNSLERENGVLDIIRFSYDHLPELALKQCFAFCSIFPKDSEMERDALIQLWMAEGFLQSSKDCSVRMEDIGEKYYRCLLSYSLFQEEDINYSGRVTCKMHDLIHDFAESISNSEIAVFYKESEKKLSSNIRHVNVVYAGETVPTILGGDAPKLRTLFSQNDVPNGVQLDYKRLRALSVHHASDAKQLSKCFRNSKSLRYLDISYSTIEEFPKFIKKLYNLQTLRFMYCKSFSMPLEGLGNLINLRHIYFSDKDHMPANLGRLANLQTLNSFYVGETKGLKIEELGGLSELRGKLTIYNLEHVRDKSEAESAKLQEKALDELSLYWWGRNEDCDEDDVLEGLRPHSKLQKFDIYGFGGKRLPSWMLKSGDRFHLNNLVVLKFERCEKLKSIPVMEGFSSLQELHIEYCEDLTDGAFTYQSLKKLLISHCPNVESFSFSGLTSLEELQIDNCGVVNITGDDLSSSRKLRILSLKYCHKLQNVPELHGLLSLRKVEIQDCDKLTCLPSGLSSCTALEELSISDCHNLVSIPEELKRLHSLVELQVYRCSNLSSFPEEILGCLSNLKTLEIGGFSNELEEFPGLGSIDNLSASLETLALYGWEKLTQVPCQIQACSALKTLGIYDFNGMEALPEWLPSCTGLEELSIFNCDNLISVPGELKKLQSLVQLGIYGCQKLKSFPEEILGSLTRLESLTIGGFSEDLEEFVGLSSIHNLHSSLGYLRIRGWEKLTQLPQQIQHLTALWHLYISDFKGVEALPEWFGNLSNLQSLVILDCPKLEILPSAEVIKSLPKFKQLEFVSDMPRLDRRIWQAKKSTSQNLIDESLPR